MGTILELQVGWYIARIKTLTLITCLSLLSLAFSSV